MRSPALRFNEFSYDWQTIELNDITNKITDGTHGTPKPIAKGVPYLTAIHVKDGVIDYENCYYLPEEEHKKIYKRCNPEKDDLLLVNIGAGTATCALNTVDYEFSLKNVALIKPNRQVVYPQFLAQYQRKISASLFNQLTSGGAQPFLSLNQIGKIKITLPSLIEQTKIANFLRVVDERITLLTQKSELLAQYKKGVMQQIFSQELRFKDDDGQDFPEWEECLLNDALIKNSSKNKCGEFTLVQSISNKHGFINQDELFEDRVIASKDLSNYYVIKKGAFAYNPSRIDVGSLAYKSDDLISVVSPLYVSFYAKPHLVSDTFLLNWFESGSFKNQMSSSFEGSVRNTLSYDSLSKITINLPCVKEQIKIANFLTTIDDKLTHTQNQLAAAKQYKQGLLQQMFV